MGTLQVGGTTLGVKNTVTNKVDLSNASIGSDTVFPAGGTGNPISVAVICDQKSYNSTGGTPSVGWNDRQLNTEISDPDSIVSIASNQFTLIPGTYLINWIVPAYKSNRTFSKLYDVTGAQDLQISKISYAEETYGVFSEAHGKYIHTISANNTYKIQQYFQSSNPTYGLGVETDVSGYNSIYSMVYIYKLK